MTRKEAREETFILVFEKQFNPDPLEDILNSAVEVRDIEPDDYIRRVFFGVYEEQSQLDELISKYSVGWNINRISKTALAVLRLALYEMLYMDDIPVSVSINEAVDLCKKYATQEDAAFVNGLLGTVVKTLS